MIHLAISTTVTRISLSLLLLAFSAHAHAITVPQIMRQAIQTGHANGLVEGPVAEKAKVSLRAQGPLNLSVTRLFEYAQEGCARLRMDFVQSNAFPPGSTKVADYSWSTEVSLCTDGQPPVNTTRKTQ